jgi:hypothetical protein
MLLKMLVALVTIYSVIGVMLYLYLCIAVYMGKLDD